MKLKTKHGLVLLSLLLPSCLMAETDVTRLFLQNAGFDSNFNYDKSATGNVAQEILEVDGWINDCTANYTITGVYAFGTAKTFNSNGKVPAEGYDGSAGCLALSTGWDQSMIYHQDVILPAAEYKLQSAFYNGSAKTAGTSLVGWIPSSGTSSMSLISSFPLKTWTTDEVTFTLSKETKGKIQIGYKAAAGASSNSAMIVLDYVRLIMTDDAAAIAAAKTILSNVISSAKETYGEGTETGAEDLNSAITKAQSVADEATDVDVIMDEKEALELAVETFKNLNISVDNPQDQTERISNPSFEDGFTGWTQENLQVQSNTSFSLKKGTNYVEKWVSSGSAGNALVSQTLKNLPNGIYILKAAAQNITQNSTARRTGAVLFAGDAETEVTARNTYSLQFTNIEGEVTIGFRATNATGNWLCVDNFELLYCAGDIEDFQAELSARIAAAEELAAQPMTENAKNQLTTAIEAAKKAETEAEITAAAKDLSAAKLLATASSKGYATLAQAIAEAEEVLDEDGTDADIFQSAITVAKSVLATADATAEELTEAATALTNALFAYRVANGTGSSPRVVTNTSFIIPAAHGALIRATISGSNILERGICWSTEKEPTVADHRSKDYYSQNGMLFHVKDMEPASVYYARAYAVTKTYAVGYGDVVKVVTLPEGSCVGTWDNGAPTQAANERCNNAIQETMDYLNEWTAIKGFRLSGHYGSGTPTADCSYGGYMRIGPNAGNQAIGTVIHETGHGVGVGTHWRWNNCADTRANTTHGKWLGSWANKTLQFLENNSSDDVFMTGDAVHGWGSQATYDWFVNGADKDKHLAIQYIGGCALLYSLYIDGLCPTTGYLNGVPGYTFNFDDAKKYYIKCEDESRGLYDGFLYQRATAGVSWRTDFEDVETNDSAAWYIEYVPETGYYRFRNAATGRYLSHGTSLVMKNTQSPSTTENFHLMPGREVLTINRGTGKYQTSSYWFAWTQDNSNKAMTLGAMNTRTNYGMASATNFDYSTKGGTKQRFIFVSEDDLEAFQKAAIPTGITAPQDMANQASASETGVYSLDGRLIRKSARGAAATTGLPAGIYIVDGKKVVVR
ncbi:MAG: cell envelope integrity protein TolA [Bacteroidaceae bacterium]|nr:cell envelope integrity protein TolA [Bacteroidaceae bacterium]